MDIEKALLDPTSVFGSPGDVVKEESLTQDQKVKILKRWEYDARNLEVAEEENMAGGPPNLLREVLSALDELGAIPGSEDASSNKQG